MDKSNIPPDDLRAIEDLLRQFQPRAPQVDLASIVESLQPPHPASPMPLPIAHSYRSISISWALGLACGIALMLLVPKTSDDKNNSQNTSISTASPTSELAPSTDLAKQDSLPPHHESIDTLRVTPMNPFGIDFNEFVTSEFSSSPLSIRGGTRITNRATQTNVSTAPSLIPSTTTNYRASEMPFDTIPQPVTTLQDLWQEFL